MQKKLALTVMSGLLLALATGCVKQNEYDALQARVQTQDQQLRQIQPMQADSWAQMQAMRQELNALKGQMDDLNNAGGARALAERVQRHDAALRQVESSMALNLNLDAPMAAPGNPMGTPMGESEAATPGEAYNATGAAQPRATAMTAPGTTSTQPVYSTPVGGQTAAAAPQKDMASALYDAGVQSFRDRKYAEAQRSFSDFTNTYPTHKQAPDAWYYVGETHFQRNQFADAALAYDKVITKHGNSLRAPGAYLKQGISFSKLGQAAAAKARMQELIKKYPNSPEAARAKNFLQTNK